MSSLATIRDNVERDLHDETNAIWSTAVLDRHIKRALREYSQVSPLEQKSTLATAADSRNVDVTTLTPRVRIVGAEYPTGEYPPEFVPFSLWGDTLTLDLVSAPSGTPNVNVYWHKVHDINGSVTFPATDDDIIATGAAAYAGLEIGVYVTNLVNVGGEKTVERYTAFGLQRLEQFHEQLRRLPAASRLKGARLYTPVETRFRSETTDPGPV